jgi:hypothetical protein
MRTIKMIRTGDWYAFYSKAGIHIGGRSSGLAVFPIKGTSKATLMITRLGKNKLQVRGITPSRKRQNTIQVSYDHGGYRFGYGHIVMYVCERAFRCVLPLEKRDAKLRITPVFGKRISDRGFDVAEVT